MATEIRVPTLGELVTEATVGQWFKKVGDTVAADEPLVELETDKVTLEVPAPSAGVIAEIAAKDGDTVGVGALLGSINPDGAAAKPATAEARACRATRAKTSTTRPIGAGPEQPRPHDGQIAARRGAPRPSRGTDAGAAPSAQKIISERNLAAAEIAGTGKDGRITKADVLAAAAQTAVPFAPAAPAAAAPGSGAAPERRRRPGARGARAHDASPPDHRPPPQGGAEQRRHADHLQRGRHERGDGAAQRIPRPLREEARRQARLHGLLREGLRPGAEGDPGGQRRDRRRRHRLQELLPYRRRRRHRARPRRPGRARSGPACRSPRSRRDRRARQTRPRRHSSPSRRCRAAPSPSPTAASTAR